MSWQQPFLFATESRRQTVSQGHSRVRRATFATDHSSPGEVVAASLKSSAGQHGSPAERAERLRQQIRRLQGRSAAIGGDGAEPVFSSGGEVLDRMLPHGGLRPGTLVEWVCDAARPGGAMLLATIAAAEVLRHEGPAGRPLVIVDTWAQDTVTQDTVGGAQSCYPPALVSLGVPPQRMVVVRPAADHTRGDLLWAIDQSLRCGAVAAVLARLGDWLAPADARRLQLAAETGGTTLLRVRPSRMRGERSPDGPPSPPRRSTRRSGVDRFGFADVRWVVSPLPGGGRRQLWVELAKCRGGVAGGTGAIEIAPHPRWLDADGPVDPSVPAVTIRSLADGRTRQTSSGGATGAAAMASDLAGRLAEPAAKPATVQRPPAKRQAG